MWLNRGKGRSATSKALVQLECSRDAIGGNTTTYFDDRAWLEVSNNSVQRLRLHIPVTRAEVLIDSSTIAMVPCVLSDVRAADSRQCIALSAQINCDARERRTVGPRVTGLLQQLQAGYRRVVMSREDVDAKAIAESVEAQEEALRSLAKGPHGQYVPKESHGR